MRRLTEFGVVPAGVPLVQRDELPVDREALEKEARPCAALEDHVIAPRRQQELAQLQAARPAAELVEKAAEHFGKQVQLRLLAALAAGDGADVDHRRRFFLHQGGEVRQAGDQRLAVTGVGARRRRVAAVTGVLLGGVVGVVS